MTRSVAAALGLGLLAGSVGCKYLPSRQHAEPVQSVLPGNTGRLPLLVGPQNGESNVTELPQKEAVVAWLRTAHELEKNKQPAAAVELYEKARDAEPRLSADISRRLAVLYDQLEEFTKAQAEYDVAIKAAPGDPELLTDLGYSYYCRGDWKKAEETLRQVVTYHADNKRAWMNLGLTLCAAGKFEDGTDAFRRCGTEAEARVNLAFMLAAQGRSEEAKEQYRGALQLEPGLKVARAALAALENPKPVVKKKPKLLTDDLPPEYQVPNIHELEKRLQELDATKSAPPRDLPPLELKGPSGK